MNFSNILKPEALENHLNPTFLFEGKIPIIFGVTGHRDISDANKDLLRGSLTDFFTKEIIPKNPHSPIVLLTALAEGADRLVAEVVLELADGHIIAVLPMPVDEYLQDFLTQASKDEFSQLLKRSFMVLDARSSQSRPQCYLEAGKLICQHSHALIGLWDGVDLTEKLGGTSNVIDMYRRGRDIYSGHSTVQTPYYGGVFHFFTSRLSSTNNKAFFQQDIIFLPPKIGGDKNLTSEIHKAQMFAAFLKIEEFNQDQIKYAGRSSIDSYQNNLYDGADKNSNKFTKQIRRNKTTLTVLALASALFHISYQGVISGWWPLAAGLLFLLGACFWWWRIETMSMEAKATDNRVIAEISRVAREWCKFGIKDPTVIHYFTGLESEIDWLRLAGKWIDLLSSQSLGSCFHANNYDSTYSEDWIKEQIDYFGGKDTSGAIKRHSDKAQIFNKTTIYLIVVALFFDFLTLVIDMTDVFNNSYPQLTTWTFFSYCAFLGFAAAISSYQSITGDAEHAREYKQSIEKFLLARDRITELGDTPDIEKYQQIIRDLGIAALQENATWLLLRRDRTARVWF